MTTKNEIRAELLAAAADYIVIDDGGMRYIVDRHDLRDGDTEESIRAMTPDQYDPFCRAVPADQRYAIVGSGDNVDLCNAMIEAGADHWVVG